MPAISFVAIIPARYSASRFPGKLMQQLGDKPVIRHTYDSTVATGLFDDVIVVTDHNGIYNEIISHGGRAVMSKKNHDSGSDRIAEAVENMDVNVIVNVQGDEPFQQKDPLQKLLNAFNDPAVQVASLMRKLKTEEAKNPHNVKVVVDRNNDSLYFSRSIIPYPRNIATAQFFLHIGVYAYRKNALLTFTRWPQTVLEQTEKLEQLRYLANGMKIRMVETDYHSIAIDDPGDLEKARTMINR